MVTKQQQSREIQGERQVIMIKVDDRVEIRGTNVDILADFMAMINALYEKLVLEEDMPRDVFYEIFTKAISIAMESADEDAAEQVEVEQSDYLS